MNSESLTRQYELLNGIRGLAAFVVVLFHVEGLLHVRLVPGGYLAVDLFFILSGFVLSRTYDERFARGLNRILFVRRRVWRFFPLNTLGLMMGATVGLLDIIRPPAAVPVPQWIAAITINLAILPTPASSSLFPLNVPAWSLFGELVVNIVFAATIGWCTGRRLTGVVLLALVAVVATTFVNGSLDGGSQWGSVWIGLSRAFFGFFFGVLLARLGLDRRGSLSPMWAFAIAPAMMFVFGWPASTIVRPWFDLAAIAVFAIVVVAGAAVRPTPLDTLSRWLGLVSFPLYAIHYPIIQAALPLSRVTGSLIAGLGVLAAAPAAALIAYFFDEWIRAQAFRRPAQA